MRYTGGIIRARINSNNIAAYRSNEICWRDAQRFKNDLKQMFITLAWPEAQKISAMLRAWGPHAVAETLEGACSGVWKIRMLNLFRDLDPILKSIVDMGFCRVKSFRKAVSMVMDDLGIDDKTIENLNLIDMAANACIINL